MAKRGRPKKGEVRAPKPGPVLHLVRVASLDMRHTLCGQPVEHSHIAPEFEDVTCKACRRIAEEHPEHKRLKPSRVDALMMRAFQDTEGQLATLLRNARVARKLWEDSGDAADYVSAGQSMADVLDGFINLLGGPNNGESKA